MKRFLSVWLVWLVVAVFALVILLSYMPLTRHAERAAAEDLRALTGAAFQRIAEARATAEAAGAQVNETVLGRTRAVARFLEHDDALLATDALTALCGQLVIECIDVSDADGVIIASSDPTHIGQNPTLSAGTAFAKAAIDDPSSELVEPDPSDAGMLLGCAARPDIEGFVLIRVADAARLAASSQAEPENVLRQMSFIRDALYLSDAADKDGVSIQDGYFFLHATQDGVSLTAARRLSTVYVIRNAVLLALAGFTLLSIVGTLVIQSLIPTGMEEPAQPADLAPADEPPALPEPEAEEAPKRRRRHKKRRPSGDGEPD